MSTHLPSPRLGMGTWGMGGKYESDESTIEPSLEVLSLGLSLGLRVIDTAELYGAGLCESIVGRAIAEVARKDVYLITKVWKTNLHYDDVLRSAESSLKRLGSSYIDLYLVHWPNDEIAISETMRAMERLVQDGIVKSIGVSNFSVAALERAQQTLKNTRISANQFGYSVTHQESRDLVTYCIDRNIEVIAYRPLAQGSISSFSHPVLERLATKYQKTKNQIALNWLMTQNVFPIPATLNLEHMHENVGALEFTLTEKEIQSLCLT